MEASDKPVEARPKRTRRSFTPQFKARLIALASEPGASVAKVAMEHQINANQLRRWMTLAQVGQAAQPMVPVSMAITSPGNTAATLVTAEVITPQATLRILGNWDPFAVALLMKSLA